MSKIKLTRPELKRQRDSLQMFSRYLPTLKLKKQQLQLEIVKAKTAVRQEQQVKDRLLGEANEWSGLLSEGLTVDFSSLVAVDDLDLGYTNIAGIKLPHLNSVSFAKVAYSPFSVPAWVDDAVDKTKQIVESVEKLKVLEKQKELLMAELKKVSQRVNLFEKVKIPECRENIRVISIFLGDEQAAGVGRAKTAKKMQEEPGRGND